MNIFKVLASSKKGFFEEQATAMLAWLLNPYMEHGLGFSFLIKFLREVTDQNDFKLLSSKLTPILRTNKDNDSLQILMDIEFNVENSFIDLILFIDKYIFSIENKIYSKSAQDEFQLTKQYEGLKKKYQDDYKIFIIFLVPTSDLPTSYHPYVQKEFNNLEIKNSNDIKKILGWPVISKIIQEILDEESKGLIQPITEYCRHTLKAFNQFITKDEFRGYYYANDSQYNGKNPLTKGRADYHKIIRDQSIKYIGVAGGISGLLNYDSIDLQSYKFQFTDEDMSNSINWISRDIFLKIADSIIKNNYDNLDWENLVDKLQAKIIYKIAKNTSNNLYIGIKGGINGLKNLSDITEKKWGLSLTKKSDQWIDKNDFIQIIDSNNIIY